MIKGLKSKIVTLEKDNKNKEAEIVRIKSSVFNMQPALSLLEVRSNETESNKLTLIMGAYYPVDIRQIDAQIEFSSTVIIAQRYVEGPIAQCNIKEPIVEGNVVRLYGGPLKASNHLVLEVQTEGNVKIKSHNLKTQK